MLYAVVFSYNYTERKVIFEGNSFAKAKKAYLNCSNNAACPEGVALLTMSLLGRLINKTDCSTIIPPSSVRSN